MAIYTCPICPWTYNTENHTQDEMPPCHIPYLAAGAAILRSNIIIKAHCPACVLRDGYSKVYTPIHLVDTLE